MPPQPKRVETATQPKTQRKPAHDHHEREREPLLLHAAYMNEFHARGYAVALCGVRIKHPYMNSNGGGNELPCRKCGLCVMLKHALHDAEDPLHDYATAWKEEHCVA